MFTILDYSSALEYSIIRRYTNIVYYCYYVDERTRRLSLSIAPVIVHAVPKGKVLTTNHVGLGMTIHQATRSNDRVNLFHKASTV